jgi:hypothetical protein
MEALIVTPRPDPATLPPAPPGVARHAQPIIGMPCRDLPPLVVPWHVARRRVWTARACWAAAVVVPVLAGLAETVLR